jgi:16S rRNA (guanine(966)-N(2))-methyltransferase RsmD
MRIISGLAKGMSLTVPHGGTRPTSDRVREAIFSSIGERVVGGVVLDLFAGTGALGLEAASRGAHAVTFVETARGALQALQRNIDTFRKGRDISCAVTIVRDEVFDRLRKLAVTGQKFSLVFADPPYGETAQTLLSDKNLAAILEAGGLLVLESGKRDKLATGPGWASVREATYGDTKVNFFARD